MSATLACSGIGPMPSPHGYAEHPVLSCAHLTIWVQWPPTERASTLDTNMTCQSHQEVFIFKLPTLLQPLSCQVPTSECIPGHTGTYLTEALRAPVMLA